MSEDWRVRLMLGDGSSGGQKSIAPSLAAQLGSVLDSGIRVTTSKKEVFLYTDTAEAAGQAADIARDLLAHQIVTADVRLERWDPAGQTWQEAAAGFLDGTADQPSAADIADREWSAKTGLARWQVRVDLAVHHEVVALAQRLASEGWPVVRRRKFLVAGANTEGDARRLAQEIQSYTSADAVVSVQKTIVGWAPLDTPSLPG